MNIELYDELCRTLTDFENYSDDEYLSDGEWLDVFYGLCVRIQNDYMERIDEMKIYIINGYTRNIGSWEVEIFKSEEEAVSVFNAYIEEYEATTATENEWYAVCSDGWFSLEERTI